MGARRKGREYALQALYLADICRLPEEKTLAIVVKDPSIEERIRQFSRWLVTGVAQHRDELDVLIVRYTKNWEMSRMAALDRNMLRIGTFELLYGLDTPVSVIIDEAVEIAKTFSTNDSGKFVNGILDKIKSERKETPQPDGSEAPSE